MRRAARSLAGAALAFCLVLAPAAGWAAGAFYALISPDRAAALAGEAATPAGRAVLRQAARQIDRPLHLMAQVHTEGVLPTLPAYRQSQAAQDDWDWMRLQALAFRLGGDAAYERRAETALRAWLAAYRPDFDPIDETRLDGLFETCDLLAGAAPADLHERCAALARRLAEGYTDPAIVASKRETSRNNWQSHRVKIATLAAYLTGDPGLIARARALYQRQLRVNLRPDGSCIDFTLRDALHYVVYDLEPLTVADLAAKAHGADWYDVAGPDGSSLKRSLDWLAPYALGTRRHIEFVHSSVPFDAARRAAGVKGFGGEWQPQTARALYTMAARLDPSFAKVRNRLNPSPGWIDLVTP